MNKAAICNYRGNITWQAGHVAAGIVQHCDRALTPLFGNGAGAFRIGKNSVVLTKIGKKYKVLCIEFFIVRLI